jgi:Tfp pilus assembly protein PilF
MGVEEFVRRLKQDGRVREKKFAFFLGAGCSVSSKIPSASTLVSEHWIPRLRDVRAPNEMDHLQWAEQNLPGFDRTQAAASYGQLIKELFVTADDRQREIESLCDNRPPAFGYAVLAQLVAAAGSQFNVVLTTNFDDLVADALYLFTDSRPLVIQHESLAAFIRPTRARPLVVKLHGDHRLAPRNTALETEELEAEIARHTAMVLNDRGLIFMGYGGNDKGILRLLDDLPIDALPSGAYWVHPEEPRADIRAWLVARRGVWVRSGWFDEVMLLIRNAFELPHPQPDRLTKVFTDYQDAFQELSKAISAKPAADPEAALLKDAVSAAERSFPDFWGALAEARRLETTDRPAAEKIYKSAIEQFPQTARLYTFYALFIESDPARRLEAEALHRAAIETEPTYAFALTRYAIFLEETPDRRSEAEEFHRRATEAGPQYGFGYARYAYYLEETPGRKNEAEGHYRKALAADPTDGYTHHRYARYVGAIPGRESEAEALYRRAIELQPDEPFHLSSLGQLLRTLPGREKEADDLEARAAALRARRASS